MRKDYLRGRENKKSSTIEKMSIAAKDKKRMAIRMSIKKSGASFLEGYGSILNIGGSVHVMSGYSAESDGDRLRGDWERIGKDMCVAINKFEYLYGKKKDRKARISRSERF